MKGGAMTSLRFGRSGDGYTSFQVMRTADDDWRNITDVTERRRIQNRLAQRNYRRKLRQRLRELEIQAGVATSPTSPGPSNSVPPESPEHHSRRPQLRNRATSNPEMPSNALKLPSGHRRRHSPESDNRNSLSPLPSSLPSTLLPSHLLSTSCNSYGSHSPSGSSHYTTSSTPEPFELPPPVSMGMGSWDQLPVSSFAHYPSTMVSQQDVSPTNSSVSPEPHSAHSGWEGYPVAPKPDRARYAFSTSPAANLFQLDPALEAHDRQMYSQQQAQPRSVQHHEQAFKTEDLFFSNGPSSNANIYGRDNRNATSHSSDERDGNSSPNNENEFFRTTPPVDDHQIPTSMAESR